VIQENIKKPLADDILFGRLARGGHVKVTLKDGKIAFEIESAGGPEGETPAPESGEPALA
jgi:ATP-dependent Clp protease ATP-binding subunit ClpA